MTSAFIGTSGFSYKHWQGVFYPQSLKQKDWLGYYSEHFDTVEINSTFYHQMRPKTFRKWRETVGANFVFSIKGSRFISHVKRLKDCQEPLKNLMEGVKALKSLVSSEDPSEHFSSIRHSLLKTSNQGIDSAFKLRERLSHQDLIQKRFLRVLLGEKIVPSPRLTSQTRAKTGIARPLSGKDVVLFQLPPRWQANTERLKDFVKILPKGFRFAFEFRDKSWLCPQIYEILKKANSALVIQDSPYWPTAMEITTGFTYLRFHGSKRLYSSNYSDRELKEWAKKIKNWLKNDLDVYAYFNNDAMGYAVENAKTLKELVGRPGV